MPTYDFQCPKGHNFEKFVPLDLFEEAKAGLPCPECGQNAPKASSAPAFSLKGAGFHANDYRGVR